MDQEIKTQTIDVNRATLTKELEEAFSWDEKPEWSFAKEVMGVYPDREDGCDGSCGCHICLCATNAPEEPERAPLDYRALSRQVESMQMRREEVRRAEQELVDELFKHYPNSQVYNICRAFGIPNEYLARSYNKTVFGDVPDHWWDTYWKSQEEKQQARRQAGVYSTAVPTRNVGLAAVWTPSASRSRHTGPIAGQCTPFRDMMTSGPAPEDAILRAHAMDFAAPVQQGLVTRFFNWVGDTF